MVFEVTCRFCVETKEYKVNNTNKSHMKKLILSFAAATLLLTTSCTKENLQRVSDITNSAGGDDHGGGSGGGKGENISASSVPDTVMSAFNTKYPGASVKEWKKLDNGNYKVEFAFNGENRETTFTAEGVIVKDERD